MRRPETPEERRRAESLALGLWLSRQQEEWDLGGRMRAQEQGRWHS